MEENTQYNILYRPHKWEEVFGQDFIVNDLKKRILEDNLPKAILLQGGFGQGKTTIAEILAGAMQAHDSEGNPDWNHPSNKVILNETFTRDTIQFDGASMRGVDEVEALVSKLKGKPLYDKYKIVILEEADQVSPTAMKSLLKHLESPAPHVKWILLSMLDKKGIPESIKSRCLVYNVKPLDVMSSMLCLKSIMEKTGDWENENIPDSFRLEGLSAIAEASRGSQRVAVKILEQCISGEIYTKAEIEEKFGTIDEDKTWQILDGLLKMSTDKDMLRTIVGLKNDSSEDGASHLYNYMKLILGEAVLFKQTGFVYDEKQRDRMERFANNPNMERLFYDLTLSPVLSKAYITTSDLVSTLGAYYQGVDFRSVRGGNVQPQPTPTIETAKVENVSKNEDKPVMRLNESTSMEEKPVARRTIAREPVRREPVKREPSRHENKVPETILY